MRAELIRDLPATPSTTVPTEERCGRRVVPKGTVIEGRERMPWFYVQMGAAVPLDDECRMAAGMTDAEIDIQCQLYEAKRLGVQPEDMAAWRAGAMIGYDPETGEWIKGPNYLDWAAKHSSLLLPGGDEDEDDDDDEYE